MGNGEVGRHGIV